MAQTNFPYRVDLWDDDGENIVDLLAEVGNLDVAMDTYRAAVKRVAESDDHTPRRNDPF